MGTRSTYRVIERRKDEKGKKKDTPFCLVYLQYDGYPDGHPLETAKWLSRGMVVNGFGLIKDDEIVFNGTGCLAAQLVAYHKDGTGGTYLCPLSHRGKSWEDYLYDIIVDVDTQQITYICYQNDKKKLFEGSPLEFVAKYDKVKQEA